MDCAALAESSGHRFQKSLAGLEAKQTKHNRVADDSERRGREERDYRER